jgi:hypothetical protein
VGRLSLALALIVLAAGAAYRFVVLDARRATGTMTVENFARESHDAVLAVARIGAAQRSYVAGSQAAGYWTTRVSSMQRDLGSRLERLESLAGSGAPQQSITSARAALGDFTKLDLTIRDHLESQDRLLASDLIFTDGIQLLDQLTEHIQSAEAATLGSFRQRVEAGRREQMWWLAGSAAMLALGLLLMAWLPKRDAGSEAASTLVADADDLPLSAPLREAHPLPRPAAIDDLAQVCSGLARVSEPQELSPLLEHAARLLNARGVVLWLADQDGSELRPAVVHGYPEQAAARMGLIATGADNATAAAFRSATLVTVAASGSPYGALVAPLVGANGCAGVLSIEVPAGMEREQHAHSVATILSAQLSGLVGTPVPSASAPAQAKA